MPQLIPFFVNQVVFTPFSLVFKKLILPYVILTISVLIPKITEVLNHWIFDIFPLFRENLLAVTSVVFTLLILVYTFGMFTLLIYLLFKNVFCKLDKKFRVTNFFNKIYIIILHMLIIFLMLISISCTYDKDLMYNLTFDIFISLKVFYSKINRHVISLIIFNIINRSTLLFLIWVLYGHIPYFLIYKYKLNTTLKICIFFGFLIILVLIIIFTILLTIIDYNILFLNINYKGINSASYHDYIMSPLESRDTIKNSQRSQRTQEPVPFGIPNIFRNNGVNNSFDSNPLPSNENIFRYNSDISNEGVRRNMVIKVPKLAKVDHTNIQIDNYNYLNTIITSKSYLDLKVTETTSNVVSLTYVDRESANPGVKTINIDYDKLKPVVIPETGQRFDPYHSVLWVEENQRWEELSLTYRNNYNQDQFQDLYKWRNKNGKYTSMYANDLAAIMSTKYDVDLQDLRKIHSWSVLLCNFYNYIQYPVFDLSDGSLEKRMGFSLSLSESSIKGYYNNINQHYDEVEQLYPKVINIFNSIRNHPSADEETIRFVNNIVQHLYTQRGQNRALLDTIFNHLSSLNEFDNYKFISNRVPNLNKKNIN